MLLVNEMIFYVVVLRKSSHIIDTNRIFIVVCSHFFQKKEQMILSNKLFSLSKYSDVRVKTVILVEYLSI